MNDHCALAGNSGNLMDTASETPPFAVTVDGKTYVIIAEATVSANGDITGTFRVIDGHNVRKG